MDEAESLKKNVSKKIDNFLLDLSMGEKGKERCARSFKEVKVVVLNRWVVTATCLRIVVFK